jgi:adenylate cyclase
MAAEIENLRVAWDYWVGAEDLTQLEKLADGLLILHEARGWYLATVGLTTDMLAILQKDAPSPGRVNQEIALRTSLARALMVTEGYTPEVEEAFARSTELFERGADAHQHTAERMLSAQRALANIYNFRGNVREAGRIGREILEFARRENQPAMRIEGHLLVATPKMFIDDLQGGLDELDRAIALFPTVPLHAFSSRAGGNDPRVACYTTSAITLLFMGYLDRAVERVNAALTLAAEIDHPFTIAFARFHSGLVHLWRRDYEVVLARTAALLEVAEEHGFHIWKAAGTILSGAAQVGLGLSEDGLARLNGGMTIYQGLRSPPVFWPMLLSIQASACAEAGRPAEGIGPIEAALEMMSPDGVGTVVLPGFQIVKGDLLRGLAAAEGRESTEAERWYRMAFERAGELKVGISRLRAATRLCSVASSAAARDTARQALAGVYATFTEGFGTRDLIEARELLEAAPSVG